MLRIITKVLDFGNNTISIIYNILTFLTSVKLNLRLSLIDKNIGKALFSMELILAGLADIPTQNHTSFAYYFVS